MEGRSESEVGGCALEVYVICIQGHLKYRWSDGFECSMLTHHEDRTTTLEG
jgi:hypothetical protein